MAKNNRKCICCAQEYRYCNSCAEDNTKPTWFALYHNENCRDIYKIASECLYEVISKEEAKERFDKCDLSYKDKLHHKIREVIDDAYESARPKEVVKIKPRYSKKAVAEKQEDSEESKEVFEQ